MKERYYLVREDILPEAVVKTMQVKNCWHRETLERSMKPLNRLGLVEALL